MDFELSASLLADASLEDVLTYISMANGDIEPCAFIHYSDLNIKDKTLLEAYKSPLFMQYRNGQPFNENHWRPRPLLDNPEALQYLWRHGFDLFRNRMRVRYSPWPYGWRSGDFPTVLRVLQPSGVEIGVCWSPGEAAWIIGPVNVIARG